MDLMSSKSLGKDKGKYQSQLTYGGPLRIDDNWWCHTTEIMPRIVTFIKQEIRLTNSVVCLRISFILESKSQVKVEILLNFNVLTMGVK